MTAFVSSCDRLRTNFDATILIVHHTGHGTDSRARGSSVLFAATDASMKVTKRDETIVLTVEVMKDADTPPPITFNTHVIEITMPGEEIASSLVLRAGTTSASDVARADLFAKHPDLRSKPKGGEPVAAAPALAAAYD